MFDLHRASSSLSIRDPYKLMMLFQSELGFSVLDSLGRFAGCGYRVPLQKQKTKRISGDSLVASPMPKSVLSGGRED